ncbi:MAG: chain length determinant protein tyrosine kinase EpsG [Thiomonas sp. 13-66-29]|jgi:chain length determinant protein tyrosine kinase EpsG|nr:MAG: chain length determinant protein tyrosine kinase EpsG [Thiomonas sp. 15-66-11]OZB50858.1 MAG: chain length determinant protein tyrosine kinase EpsG [Thiomonas sp. 14-66-4]OZB66215.1 MAG: chain length determinant protein tyrosine kinase EpsG [Thiomonas sp. 13-66-29]
MMDAPTDHEPILVGRVARRQTANNQNNPMSVLPAETRSSATVPMALGKDLKLGQLLLDSGKLSAADAERVLRLQKAKNLRFGDAAVRLGLVSEQDILLALSQQFDYPYLAPGANGFSDELVAAYQPFTPQVEQLRALRSQLMLRWFGTGQRSLALVGTGPTGSMSNLAANLAIVFSQLGERTLLIDANLRRPMLHELFNLPVRHGLSDVLIGRAGSEAAVRIEPLLGLTVLSAGTQPPNPAELLARPTFAELLALNAEVFDVILVNTAPTHLAEILPVCAATQGALLMVDQHLSAAADVRAAASAIQHAGLSLVGSVLNRR